MRKPPGFTCEEWFRHHYEQRLGGPDMKTLYVTAGKTLYKIRTDIAGLPR